MLFFVLLSNTLNYMRLSAFHIDVVKGAIILAAALLDVLRTRLVAGGRHVSDPILALRRGGQELLRRAPRSATSRSRSAAAACSGWSGRTARASRR